MTIIAAIGKAYQTYHRSRAARAAYAARVVGSPSARAAQRVHARKAATARSLMKNRRTVQAAAPSQLAAHVTGTVGWFGAPMGSNRKMPLLAKILVIVLVFTFLPWSMMRHVPWLPLIPGMPLSPTTGFVWRMILPDISDSALESPGQPVPPEVCAQITPHKYADPYITPPSGGVIQAGLFDRDGKKPWLTSAIGGTTKGVVEDLQSPDALRSYGHWLLGLTRVVFSTFGEAFTGTVEPSSYSSRYDAAIRSAADSCVAQAAALNGAGDTSCLPEEGAGLAYRAAAQAGFTGEDLRIAVMVAGAESGYRPDAANPTSSARGMWQIMLSAHRDLPDIDNWADPYANARMAYSIFRSAGGWSPWTTYTSGAYRTHAAEVPSPCRTTWTASTGTVAGGPQGRFKNGQIPLSELSPVPWSPNHLVWGSTIPSLVAMNNAYRAEFGTDMVVTDGYRSLAGQINCRRAKGSMCADPGTSNHGWGLAIDWGGGINRFGTPQHNWMVRNAPQYGWVLPGWAQQSGSKPEAWHWEYQDTISAG